MPWPIAYIADVRASEAKLAIIASRHDVTYDEVREAVVLTRVRRSAWLFDAERRVAPACDGGHLRRARH
jgi:hypothetical protein